MILLARVQIFGSTTAYIFAYEMARRRVVGAGGSVGEDRLAALLHRAAKCPTAPRGAESWDSPLTLPPDATRLVLHLPKVKTKNF